VPFHNVAKLNIDHIISSSPLSFQYPLYRLHRSGVGHTHASQELWLGPGRVVSSLH
jgi:hypothetical protein